MYGSRTCCKSEFSLKCLLQTPIELCTKVDHLSETNWRRLRTGLGYFAYNLTIITGHISVMQSPPSVCFQFPLFWTDWPLTVNFRMWVGRDHSSPGSLLKASHRSRSMSRIRLSVRPRPRAVCFLVDLTIHLVLFNNTVGLYCRNSRFSWLS